jgi:hypothetical protein
MRVTGSIVIVRVGGTDADMAMRPQPKRI